MSETHVKYNIIDDNPKIFWWPSGSYIRHIDIKWSHPDSTDVNVVGVYMKIRNLVDELERMTHENGEPWVKEFTVVMDWRDNG